jgi:hypothetical protein
MEITMHGKLMGRGKQAGTFGYMEFATAAEARKVGKMLGCSGSHSHRNHGTTVYHPGNQDHMKLNEKLRKEGLPQLHDEMCCGGKHQGMMGGGMADSATGSAVAEDGAIVEDIFDDDSGMF